MDLKVATTDLMPMASLYDCLRLRSDVFDLEQRCTENDLDGRDLEAGTVHYWFESGNRVIAYLRVLQGDPGNEWVGRICTDRAHRGKGLSAQLVNRVIERHGSQRLWLHGQTYLLDWYRKFGFEVVGGEFEQAGLPHCEMVRQPQ